MGASTSVRGPEDAYWRLRSREEPADGQVLTGLRPPDDLALSLPGDEKEDGARIEKRGKRERDPRHRRLAEAGRDGTRQVGGGQRVLQARIARDERGDVAVLAHAQHDRVERADGRQRGRVRLGPEQI